MILRILFFLIFFISNALASITDDLLKLSDMYQQGLLTKDEFTKAKSILLQIEEIEKEEKLEENITKKKDKKPITKKKIVKKTKDKVKAEDTIKVRRIYTTKGSKFTNKNFEKMKVEIGDYNIYTHRPGAIKIKQISNNKQLAVIGDKLKVKYYNSGRDILDIETNTDLKELTLKINNAKVLFWKGQYVQQAEATFYQILVMGRLPFHFYIIFDKADNAVALNMEKFNRTIELAVNEVKKDLSIQYNISLAQIESIIEENDMMAAYGEKIPTNLIIDSTDQKKNKLYAQLKNSIGDDAFSRLKSTFDIKLKTEIDSEVNKQVKIAIDDSIRDAINSGIEAAALEAAINALLDALLSGASWADALKAAEQACAGSGDC